MNKNYIFPSAIANAMKNISVRTQMEASLMAMVFIMAGTIIFSVYLVFWTEMTMFSRIMIGVNALAGFVFLASYLVTTFQQYQQYLAVIEAQNQTLERRFEE